MGLGAPLARVVIKLHMGPGHLAWTLRRQARGGGQPSRAAGEASDPGLSKERLGLHVDIVRSKLV